MRIAWSTRCIFHLFKHEKYRLLLDAVVAMDFFFLALSSTPSTHIWQYDSVKNNFFLFSFIFYFYSYRINMIIKINNKIKFYIECWMQWILFKHFVHILNRYGFIEHIVCIIGKKKSTVTWGKVKILSLSEKLFLLILFFNNCGQSYEIFYSNNI